MPRQRTGRTVARAAGVCLVAMAAGLGAPAALGQEAGAEPQEERVEEARRSFARALGIPPPSVYWRGTVKRRQWPLQLLDRDVVLQPYLLPPIHDTWEGFDYSPAGGEYYYDAPFYLRTQARYAVRLRP